VEDAKAFERPLPVLHNCSGKHAGMLTACASSGWDVRTYLDPVHPLQRAVHEAFVETAGVRDPVVGVDGCGAPVFSGPLSAMATLFARLVTAGGGDALSEGMRKAVEAMRREPYLVAGRDRIDTALMQEVDTLVVKIGAEGLVCVGVLDRGIGVAVRVDDGSPRAADPATVRALHLLEVVGNEQVEALEAFARPPVMGGGRPVGRVTSDFVLHGP
jgi:L-asparaginase II